MFRQGGAKKFIRRLYQLRVSSGGGVPPQSSPPFGTPPPLRKTLGTAGTGAHPPPSPPGGWTSWGPKAAVGEGSPTTGVGASAWTHPANREGSCPPLWGPHTEQ